MHLPLVRTMDILWIIFVCQVVRYFTVAPAGLCERHRVISQHNNNCGSGCEGLCMICEIHCARNFVSMQNFVNTLHTCGLMRGLICWHEERQCMKCRGPILDTKKCPVTCQEEQADGILIKDMRNVEIRDCWEDTTVPNERQT